MALVCDQLTTTAPTGISGALAGLSQATQLVLEQDEPC